MSIELKWNTGILLFVFSVKVLNFQSYFFYYSYIGKPESSVFVSGKGPVVAGYSRENLKTQTRTDKVGCSQVCT